MLIQQQIEAHLTVDLSDAPAHLFSLIVGSAGVIGVIVVPENAELAVTCRQLREPFDPRLGLIAVVIDQIPREAQDIRIQGLDEIQPTLHRAEVFQKATEVGIADLNDAQPIQR